MYVAWISPMNEKYFPTSPSFHLSLSCFCSCLVNVFKVIKSATKDIKNELTIRPYRHVWKDHSIVKSWPCSRHMSQLKRSKQGRVSWLIPHSFLSSICEKPCALRNWSKICVIECTSEISNINPNPGKYRMDFQTAYGLWLFNQLRKHIHMF